MSGQVTVVFLPLWSVHVQNEVNFVAQGPCQYQTNGYFMNVTML